MQAVLLSKGRALAALAAAAAFAGCFPSYHDSADDTRAALMGKSGAQLRQCLGPPTEWDEKDRQELLTYRWTFKPDPRPRIGPDNALTRSEDPQRSNDPKDLGHCELVFQVGKTGVNDLTVRGRDPQGLNADSRCLAEARKCRGEHVPVAH